MLRHNEMPEIEVYIVPSTETPGGIGEPSTALAAGSLVNAIAAATGKRIYKLPIKPGACSEAELRRSCVGQRGKGQSQGKVRANVSGPRSLPWPFSLAPGHLTFALCLLT